MKHGRNVKHYTSKQEVFVQLHENNYDYDIELLTLTIVRHMRLHHITSHASAVWHALATQDTLLDVFLFSRTFLRLLCAHPERSRP